MPSHVRSGWCAGKTGRRRAMRAAAAISDAPVTTAPQRVVRALLFIGFAFAVMADPVSSVAYTIEASLRALNGHLGLLMATQIIVLAIIALVDVNYWQLVGRFPLGGGSAEAAARAFGTGWVFLPIGALIVDFVLTITISVAAAVSALIAYVPVIAPARIALGLACWWGRRLDVVRPRRTTGVRGDDAAVHRKRRRDARSWFRDPVTAHGRAPMTGPEGSAVLAVVLSFPVAMALATGTEAPATAIGQLGQLGADDRRRFARGNHPPDDGDRGRADDRHHRARRAAARRHPVRRLHPDRGRRSRRRREAAQSTHCSKPPARCCCWPPPARRSRPARDC